METKIKTSNKVMCEKCVELEERINELEERLEVMHKDYLKRLSSLQCKVISFQSQFIELLPTDEADKLKKEEAKIFNEKNDKISSSDKEALEFLDKAIGRHEYKPILQIGKTEDDG